MKKEMMPLVGELLKKFVGMAFSHWLSNIDMRHSSIVLIGT
jgi:hypothetical protein